MILNLCNTAVYRNVKEADAAESSEAIICAINLCLQQIATCHYHYYSVFRAVIFQFTYILLAKERGRLVKGKTMMFEEVYYDP